MTKKENPETRESIRRAGDRIKWLEEWRESLVECDRCGCLIEKREAIKGKSEIRERYVIEYLQYSAVKKEYIHTPYYCKAHKPKGLK